MGVLGSVVALSFRPLTDYDLPWNLATGRIIWNTRSIPRVDDLAFTARPLRYVEPLGDLSLFLTQHAFGFRGLQVLGALSAGLTLLTLYAMHRRAGPIALVVIGFAAAALADWFYLRPVLFSYAALPFTLLLLSTHRASPGTRRGRGALAGLVILHWAWANIHGFVAIGCALVVGYAAIRLLARLARERAAALFPRRDSSDLGWTSGIAALVVVASSLSPGGPRLLLGSLRYGEVNTGITEWARPDVRYLLYDQPVAAAFVATMVIAWLAGREPESGRRVPDAFSLGVVSLGLFAFFHAVRMTPTAIVLLAAIVPPRFPGGCARARWLPSPAPWHPGSHGLDRPVATPRGRSRLRPGAATRGRRAVRRAARSARQPVQLLSLRWLPRVAPPSAAARLHGRTQRSGARERPGGARASCRG